MADSLSLPDITSETIHDPDPRAVFVLSGATGATLLELSSAESWDLFGLAAVGRPDINGDGVPEVVVAAPTNGVLSDRVGRVHVFSGADGSRLHTVYGRPMDRFGLGLAIEPDFDGDGIDELLVDAVLLEIEGDDGDLVFETGETPVYRLHRLIFSGSDGSRLFDELEPLDPADLIGAPLTQRSIPGDLDRSGAVDGADLGLLLSSFGTTVLRASRLDLNRDRIVDTADLSILLAMLGKARDGEYAAGGFFGPLEYCDLFPCDPVCDGGCGPGDPGGEGTAPPGGLGEPGSGSGSGGSGGGGTLVCWLSVIGEREAAFGETILLLADPIPEPSGVATWTLTSGSGLISGLQINGNTCLFTAGAVPGLVTLSVSYSSSNCVGTKTVPVAVDIDECFLWVSGVGNRKIGDDNEFDVDTKPAGGVLTWEIIEGAQRVVEPYPGQPVLRSAGPAGPVIVRFRNEVNGCVRETDISYNVTVVPGADTDDDGLIDTDEFVLGTSAIDADTDGDGYNDGCEVAGGFDPLDPGSPDPDGPAVSLDTDTDGLPDLAELCLGLDPAFFDSDGDGLGDGWEVENGYDPTEEDSNQNGLPDGEEDTDGDGLDNIEEQAYGTDSFDPDTDGDGVSDGQEAAQGSFPSDPSDDGEVPEGAVQFTLTIGDHSSSQSERWGLRVGAFRLIAPTGEVISLPFPFQRGQSYTITIDHLGSTVSPPDYDYTAGVAPTSPGADGWIVVDPHGMLGVHGESSFNFAAGKSATLHLVKVNLTAHRTISWSWPEDAPLNDVAESAEEAPGVGVRLHDSIIPAGEPGDPSDLIKVRVEAAPVASGGSPPAGIQWFLVRENANIQVWKNETPFIGDEFFEGADLEQEVFVGPFDVWVESVSPGSAPLKFEARSESSGAVIAMDRIVFFSFSSVVVVLTGEAGLPTGDNSFNHGTTPLAIAIADEGYDVHLLREEEVSSTGAGGAYEVIAHEIERHGVSGVAIIGYSHGGGSTYDLAARLDFVPPGAAHSLAHTAYIDGIEQGETVVTKDIVFEPETRLPRNTQSHTNLWQPVPTPLVWGVLVYVHGAQVAGSTIDINVNNPPPAGWGLSLDHVTIDDDPQVHSTIIQGVKSNVTR